MANDRKMVKVGGEEMPLEVLNNVLISDLNSCTDGMCKKAADLSSAYLIKMIVREDGFLRKILPPEQIGEQDLDKFPDHDRPGKIITIEPAGYPAATLPFGVSNDIQYYYASKAVVPFFDIKTPRFQKNVYELMTYKDIDLRKVVVDNALKDMQKQEDAGFIAGVDQICGATTGNGNYFTFSGGLNRDTWVETSKIMGKKMLHNGIALMNDATLREFGKLDRTEWGGDGAETVWKEGMSGMGDGKLFGMNILSTLKADIVNDNIVYLFTEPDYLGKMYELQKPTMYVKREEDILTVNAGEKIGTIIANTAGVAKIKFNSATSFTNSDYPIPSVIVKA